MYCKYCSNTESIFFFSELQKKKNSFKGNVICFSDRHSERNTTSTIREETSRSVNHDSFLKYLLMNCHEVLFIFSGELNLRVIRTIAILLSQKNRLEEKIGNFSSTFEFSITIKPSLFLSFSKNYVSELKFFEREYCCCSSFFSLMKIENFFVHSPINNDFCTNDMKELSVKDFVVTCLVAVRINFEQNL